ncbi:DUF6273 domain-containing protein [Paenibacillus timonensis]|uniref:DUF6273 domain-containing protein n=1 Tax=Paenibacillus timonensis TaxID=225915 RepID=A0ABW3SGS0_9BACL|nr:MULTISPECIES: DUF6273 domain-containing protein [Paenibacillus]MCH1642381.1 DUF6273 domain-containing protein [Paenibacillus timonensis]MDU2239178.1 DUF6273 domain-containing protein [Paenibacillus sp.]GJM77697.1 hypothetical protein HMSSN139_01930 [Paenibacillus sp. HMSSN-139]
MDRGYQPASVHAIQPGERMTFGLYPQSADGEVRPIVWRVLQNMGSELFLLSEEILECKRYHGKNADISWRDAVDTTWRDCDLRQWLNEEFYATAFGADEQKMIMTTHCGDNGEGSPDTEDKVFLLSVTEIKALTAVLGKAWLTAVGTDYAKLKKPDGCSLYVYDKNEKDNYVLRNGKEEGCSWWWLRTQGNKPSRAHFIGTGSSIRSYANVSLARDGVRPAIRLMLG